MGKKSKKHQDRIDPWDTADDYRHETESTRQSNGNRGRDRGWNEDWTSAIPNNRHDDVTSEGREPSVAQTDFEFDPYLVLVEDLKMKMEASRTVAEDVLVFYTQHQLEIQKVNTTRQRLNEMTKKCSDYSIVISSLQKFEGEKRQELDKEAATIKKDRKELDVLKEEVARHKQQLAEEKREFEDMIRTKEAEQLLKLQEEKAKLATEHNKKYDKRVEELEKATKKSQDDDRKKILDLEIKNDELVQGLEEQRRKLKDTEKRCRDVEKLRSLSETEVEDLSQKLKMAENDQSEFLKIHNDVHAISSRYVEQIKVNDLDADVHDKIEEVDDDFISVPISNSIVSKELCLAHFQRVISSQLQAILLHPFSSEITVQDPNQTSLLNQIYYGLAESFHEGKSSLRAARTWAALTMRSLHSQSTSTIRAEIFTDNIMKVLSLLLNPKIHPTLRKDLTHLATSAISLCSIVQTDRLELQVHPTLDPASFEKPEEDIDIANSRVFVLFPRVTARSCPQIGNARPVGPPGGWVDSRPESQFEEICIHKGVGIPEWEQLVRVGEEEEVDRRRKQEIESNEKKRRELEEEIEKLNKPDLGHKRGISYSRRNSVVVGKSTPSSPTSAWLGAQKIPERG
ncbi:Uncharacterized protein BP5553_06598 [Venustampulla echinocandica]|uniref:Uncharacterized protein n=1 Tax=Venustampulla echinocandica TaxID=2656787 RepID=A0A370TKD7_9HELO|nr:Uncharacterized protein BP5553_06598 [Venustampulla echinocandica]RDL35986.1 Uncharacterized protein BP5553_06598 [Venustampulla echinocandica]